MPQRALPPDAEAPETIEWAGQFVEARRRGRWEYAGRPGGMRAAVILALDGGDVILVEQYRVPLGKFCLELPAGLIGDEGDASDALSTGVKELEEETGYHAAQWEELGEFYSSPGMLSESFTLVKATGLARVGDGGGTQSEDITVHRVPLDQVAGFARQRGEAGVAMDVKMLMLLASSFLEVDLAVNVIILGAGAMGCLYGAALHRARAQVTLVDVNQPHVDAINARGLELELRSGTELLPIPAKLPAHVIQPADLVVVFTKTFQTEAALAGISAAIAPETWLLSLQNGLGNDQRLAAHAALERVMVGASTLPADLVGRGQVRSHGEGGSKLYPAFGGNPAFAAQVAELLTAGGLPAQLDPEIHAAIWSKAIFNAAMNPLCALTLRTPGFLGAHGESRALYAAVVEEGVAVARASGIIIEAQPIHDLTQVSVTDHANHEASMLQDVKAGRRTEVDAINGAIVQAGRKVGVAAPVTETLWRLVKLEEAKL